MGLKRAASLAPSISRTCTHDEGAVTGEPGSASAERQSTMGVARLASQHAQGRLRAAQALLAGLLHTCGRTCTPVVGPSTGPSHAPAGGAAGAGAGCGAALLSSAPPTRTHHGAWHASSAPTEQVYACTAQM